MKKIKYIVLDVDGTLTDGGIYHDENDRELKKFNTKDGLGIILARKSGICIVALTGRTCKATERRMKELNIDYLFQGVKEKEIFLSDFMQKHKIEKEEIGYIGDDLNDIKAIKLVGFIGCPADAAEEVKKLANYVSEINGGNGAVRDIISYILKQQDDWDQVIETVYGVV